ncbi:MAG: serine hydroxymethyltransferase [Candidatus Moraniibacteriota bacterium]|nr:MAG: serine hydroxymethyltransferase [Candidatus Moranbacteria bacterium]
MKRKSLKMTDRILYELIKKEKKRQEEGMELIPSENYASLSVLEALGSVFTNKYSEGYPGKRYYGGQIFVDQMEQLAIDRAKELFGAEHINVQPLSGAPANLAVYSALLLPGETVLGMDLSHGGHLTHGHPVTVPAKIYRFERYKTESDGKIDYQKLLKQAKEVKPKILLAGFSSYTRRVDFSAFCRIAKEVGAISFFDMAHVAGLVAGKVYPNPVSYFDIVTTTTHKSLRGPRGGMILCKKEFAQAIDKAVFPGLQGGPHENNIAAKAVAFGEALKTEFHEYATSILENAKVLEKEFKKRKYVLAFGGTDSHMLVVDTVQSFSLTGKQVETALDSVGITVNKNVIPDDSRGPLDPSGIRLGTPAVTTRGMRKKEMEIIAEFIDQAIQSHNDEKKLKYIQKEVKTFCKKFPVYSPN